MMLEVCTGKKFIKWKIRLINIKSGTMISDLPESGLNYRQVASGSMEEGMSAERCKLQFILTVNATLWYMKYRRHTLFKKRTMKRIIRIICFLILIPLVPALTQAAHISALDCVHCQKIQVSKPDCCKAMNRSDMEIDGVKAEKDNEPCPHAGFCQEGLGPASQLLPFPAQIEIAALVSFVTVTYKSYQPDYSWHNAAPLPALKSLPRLFTLNCSFLI